MRRLALTLAWLAGPGLADPVEITAVKAVRTADTWRFDVTVQHPDTGWDHYTDGWRVEDADGNELALRALAHPHVNEQPFTRSQGGVVIPEGVTEVYIRARCNLDGWNEGATVHMLASN